MVDVVFLYRWHSSECLANLMMKYSCAVGGPEEQSGFFCAVLSLTGKAVEGDLVEPVAHIKLHEDLCPFQLVSKPLLGGDMVPCVLGSLIDRSHISHLLFLLGDGKD